MSYRRYGVDGIARFLEDTYRRPPTAHEVGSAITVIESFDSFQVGPNDNMLVLDIFEEAAGVAATLHGKKWTLLRSEEDIFLTCDRPVVPWRKRTKKNRHLGVGPANADEVYFPLDPRQMIVISSAPTSPWMVEPVTRERAGQINQRVAHWSTRWIYHRPAHNVLGGVDVPREGPILHVNGIPVRDDVDIWARIRKGFIDGTSLPVIHAGYGVDVREE
jgi:hypothetical protein